tara:strand:- start:12085 stop:12258 length:174 start_codon:yes stop_codon:yes gene_type:complete
MMFMIVVLMLNYRKKIYGFMCFHPGIHEIDQIKSIEFDTFFSQMEIVYSHKPIDGVK